MNNSSKKANRLLNEKSPYLLQHAYNPVNWFPWGDEAFNKAQTEDKPIFLSIGYSTCHWCHVMERESFEDEQVAEVLNKYFVSIKVDREERPDIDNIYMAACQAVTGSGGWPLTIIMAPDKKPFFAGTYFPKETKAGYMGLIEILNKVNELWQKDKSSLVESSNNIVNILKDYSKPSEKEEFDESVIKETYKTFCQSFDNAFGGFGYAPKFPFPHNINFLLMYWQAFNEDRALDMAKTTLDSMYKGGIFDHIGFGFSRYSVDKKWLVPHFEKMLYDNALLSYAYIEAYQATGEVLYKQVADKIFTYVLRDMVSPDGAFYSAEDADSEGEEGKFYLWTKDEVEKVLGQNDGTTFCKYYNITEEGNFEHKNIPNLIGMDLKLLDDPSIKSNLEKSIEKLYAYRERRVHPYKDDKILTSWNGLMIASLAYAGRVLGNYRYTEAARCALNFIFSKLQNTNGRLLSRFRDGEAVNLGYIDDYAFIIWALIEMYENTYETDYLERAIKLNKDMFKIFWDEENGGLFLSGKDSEELILKSMDAYDGAIPSGNSVAAANNMRLAKITGDVKLEEKANDIFKTFGSIVKKMPQSYSKMVTAFLYSTIPGRRIVISGRKEDENVNEMLKTVSKKYLPYTTVIFNDGSKKIYDMVPFIEKECMIENKATAYICKNFTCGVPITNMEQFKISI